MFKSTQEFDSAIKGILIHVRDGENLNTIPSDEDSHEALVECIDRRYLQGVAYRRTADGKPHFTSVNVRITYSGLGFIESH